MFDDILSKSHSYKKRKSLKINEIQTFTIMTYYVFFL
jgi:hypothetical protein